MNFLALATIRLISTLTVPQGMMLFVATPIDCATIEDSCTWGIAGSISEAMLKNLFFSFMYDNNPTTISPIIALY